MAEDLDDRYDCPGLSPRDDSWRGNVRSDTRSSGLFAPPIPGASSDFVGPAPSAPPNSTVVHRWSATATCVTETSEVQAVSQFDLRRSARYKRKFGDVGAQRTVLDRKYASLDGLCRAVLRRIAVFAGEFTLEAASAVVAGGQILKSDVAPSIVALQASSLLKVAGEGAFAHYRLNRPIRAFAFEKLVRSGELDSVARNHAEYLQCVFEYAEVEMERRELSQWVADYGGLIADVRAALDWAFSPSGDATIGVGLTMAAIPLWLSVRSDELRYRIKRALKSEAATIHSGHQMRLRTAARIAGITDV